MFCSHDKSPQEGKIGMRGRKIIEAVQLEHNFTYGEIYDKNRIESGNGMNWDTLRRN